MDIPQISGRPARAFAEPVLGHVSLGKSLRSVLVIGPALLLAGFLFATTNFQDQAQAVRAAVTEAVGLFVLAVVVSGVRVAAQWERGVILRLGSFRGVKGPGIIYVVPVLDYLRFVDIRTLALNIPSQKVITKDNVPASIDGVLFFLVADAGKAVTVIQDYVFAISQYAQAALRDVVGGLSLDDLLTEREQIQTRIGQAVEQHIKDWGVHVDSIRLLDIEMPEDLKRMMSRQASAEREKRATITKAEGDKMAAVNLAAAATTMAASPGAMQLRTLQSIDGLGASPSNTVVLFPAEFGDLLKRMGAMLPKPEAPKS